MRIKRAQKREVLIVFSYPGRPKAIAMPWSETPIDFVKVKKILNRSTAIFSDDDEYVPISDSGLFNERLNSKILIEKGKGHFMDKKYDFILKEFLKLSA